MHDITVDEHAQILEIRLMAAVSFEEHVAARKRALEICRERGLHKILVDASSLKDLALPTTISLYEFGLSWPALAREFKVVLAGVLPKDPDTRKWLSFGDNVATNRGFESAAFEDAGQARAWLQGVRQPES